ncbi:MAG TPA: hypothetical protein VFN48_08610, partial [Solirubrobacteraceae bacterium]|nr:hypothetical protein [Solirubrobacteraceae bacterium]
MSARTQAKGTVEPSGFTLERFSWIDGDRYEVQGRWTGVRGRRCIRPELTFIDGDDSRRLLADLDQKPWQPEEDALWTVAFPAETEMPAESHVELTVAPDLVIAVRGAPARERPVASQQSPA